MTNFIRSYIMTYKIVIMGFFVVYFDGISYSQHDAHSGAVREIAGRKKYDVAEKSLNEVNKDPGALWNSLNNAYERAGKRFGKGG